MTPFKLNAAPIGDFWQPSIVAVLLCLLSAQLFFHLAALTEWLQFLLLKGDDTNKVILIGAHYDGQGYFVSQAADDNASGVAAVLECARLCAGKSFACTLVFALWDEKESGSVGSQAFISSGILNGKQLLGSINFFSVIFPNCL